MKTYKQITDEMIQRDCRYLELLSHSFPTIATASTEIINLEAILNLPKGTEHFLADLHGEYEAFQHVLRTASGAIKRKVNEIFENTLRETEKKELCTLIYYPEQKLQLVKDSEEYLEDWYVEIHPLEGAQGVARRVLVHHSGVASRKQHGAEQAGVYQRNYQYDNRYEPCRRFHRGAV